MTRITPDDPDSSTESQAIFKELEAAFGMVPNLVKTLAHYLPLLALNWNRVNTLIMSGNLSRKVKETIAVLVSKDNNCRYCVTAHTLFLQTIVVPEDELFAINDDLEKTSFSVKEKAVILFARQANNAPLEVSDEGFKGLRV